MVWYVRGHFRETSSHICSYLISGMPGRLSKELHVHTFGQEDALIKPVHICSFSGRRYNIIAKTQVSSFRLLGLESWLYHLVAV